VVPIYRCSLVSHIAEFGDALVDRNDEFSQIAPRNRHRRIIRRLSAKTILRLDRTSLSKDCLSNILLYLQQARARHFKVKTLI